jgi:hypothetical protein
MVERLPSTHETLSSTLSPVKKKREEIIKQTTPPATPH